MEIADHHLVCKSPKIKCIKRSLVKLLKYINDAIQELKDLQMDSEDGDMLLEIWRGLGATLESVAQGGSSVIRAIDVVIRNTLNGVGDLEEKVVGGLGEATSKVIESTEHTFKNSTMGIGNMFCGILGVIRGMI